MQRRIIYVCFTLLLGLWILICQMPSVTQAQEQVSKPGEYSGYSPVLYNGDQLFSQYVTVRDGTKLAVDIWRPKLDGKLVTKPLPVIWMHSPYNRRYYPATGPHLAVDLYPGAARGLIKYGYVVAVVDARGLYASFGSAVAYNRGEWMPSAFWDAYDITEWFAAQPWCDGKVGMWGCSATGGTQLQATASQPPHLKAVFPMSCEGDFWGTGNGVVSSAYEGQPAPAMPYWASYNAIASPVDEDTDKSMLAAAGLEQKNGVDIGYAPYRDSISPWILEKIGLTVRWNIESSPHSYFKQIEHSKIPMYNTVNWEDNIGVRWGPIMRFKNLSNPSKLLLGPAGHCIWYTDYSPKPYPATFRIVNEEHRWFDYWLKGIDNGIMDEPPIYMFTYNKPIGDDWRFAWQWPLPNEKRVKYFLGTGPSEGPPSGVNNGSLSVIPPSVPGLKDDYLVDYTVTAENRNELGLTYTTAPLANDLEITGDPVVELWISSTAADGDFFAYLEDVNPDGSTKNIYVDGNQRSSYRALHTPLYDNWGLPYHRSYEEDISPLTPNSEPVKLAFKMGPTSYVFKEGHRIRLIITCTSAATPKLSPAPTVSIYRNPVQRSLLVLPIGGTPLYAHVQVEPKVLNVKGKGLFTVFVNFLKSLAKEYLEDLNTGSVTCNGVSPASSQIANHTLILKFNRQDFAGIANLDKVKLTCEGTFGAKFNYGDLSFEGSDWIKVEKRK